MAARHEPDQRRGHRKRRAGGPLITACILRVVWREGRRKVLKATRPCPAAAPVSTASTSSRQTLVFHFPPFFPSFLSAPHMSDSTPRLPSASHPPAESAQRGSSETSSKGLSPRRSVAWVVPCQPFPKIGGAGRDPGTHQEWHATLPKWLPPAFFFVSLSGAWGGGYSSNSHWAGLRGAADQT